MSRSHPLERFLFALMRGIIRAVAKGSKHDRKIPKQGARLSKQREGTLATFAFSSVAPRLPFPETSGKTLQVPILPYRTDAYVTVDLSKQQCACTGWVTEGHDAAQHGTLGRCCTHLVSAILADIGDGENADPWSMRVLRASGKFAPPARFESAVFSNGEQDFLALYDIRRGYVQLFSRSGEDVQWGYDSSRNRWAHGYAPDKPLIIKKNLRPWVKAMDLRHGNGVQR